MADTTYYVYILASSFRKLYIGVTNDLPLRVRQHKEEKDPYSHTARYTIDKLVYYERFASANEAIPREKQLKGWLRLRKLALIVSINPGWTDLSEDWGKAILPFNQATHHNH